MIQKSPETSATVDVLQLAFIEKTNDTHCLLAKEEVEVKKAEISGENLLTTHPTENKRLLWVLIPNNR